MAEMGQMTLHDALLEVQRCIQLGTPDATLAARELCRRVLEVMPSNGHALYCLGVIEFNSQDYGAAIERFRLAIEADPAVSAPHFFLGRALFESGRYADAEVALRHAVKLQPNQPDFLMDLARVLAEQGNFLESLQHCDAAIVIAPNLARTHILRAHALQGLGRSGEAVAACTRAIEFDPFDAKLHHNLAIFLQKLGEAHAAEASLRKAIELQPDFEPAYSFLAGCLRNQGRIREAVALLESLNKLNPSYPDIDVLIAETQAMLLIEQRAQTTRSHLKPLFILAPVARCGSTLLQRLFNSSEHMIMFGENEDVSRRLPACVDFALSKAFLTADLSETGNVAKFLTEDWVAGLFPGRGAGYLDLSLRNFYDVIEHYQLTANKLSRAWGIKEPHAGQLCMLRSLLPDARFICIYRDLFDVARSYKARGWLSSTVDVIKLADEWQEEIRKMLFCGNHNVLIIKYEELVAYPDRELARIEDFAGISRIDRKLMHVRVNVAEHDRQGRSVSVYRQPQELTQTERDTLREYAYGMLSHLGYI